MYIFDYALFLNSDVAPLHTPTKGCTLSPVIIQGNPYHSALKEFPKL